MIQTIERLPQLTPLHHPLKGDVEIESGRIAIGGCEVPRHLHKRLAARTKGYENLQQAVNEKDLYLRGRVGKEQRVEWFGLVTDKFRALPLQEVVEVVEREHKERVIRYLPDKERFILNYTVGEIERSEGLKPVRVSMFFDTGNYGLYGGHGQMALRAGISTYDGLCTNWTMFLSQKKLRVIHRNDVAELEATLEDLNVQASKTIDNWKHSNDIMYDKETLGKYAAEYGEKAQAKKFFERLLEGVEGKISAYDLAWKMTKDAQNIGSDATRLRLEMLAAEVISSADQIKERYAQVETVLN